MSIKSAFLAVRDRVASLMHFFRYSDPDQERRQSGFSHFVLLMTLAPFVLSLTLFDLERPGSATSFYELDPDRFASIAPVRILDSTISDQVWSLQTTNKPQLVDRIVLNKPLQDLDPIVAAGVSDYIDQHPFPSDVQRVMTIVLANPSFSGLPGQPSLDATIQAGIAEARSRTDRYVDALTNAVANSLQRKANVVYPAYPEGGPASMATTSDATLGGGLTKVSAGWWLIAFALYLPAVVVCLWRRQLGTLFFGLAVPNAYALAVILVLSGIIDSNSHAWIPALQLFVPKIAFFWFALRGGVLSRPFLFFTALASAYLLLFGPVPPEIPFVPKFVSALLPILVFVMGTAIARLIAMGVAENAYFLRSFGFLRTLRTVARSALLWLPMALVALPYFVFTEEIIPASIVNTLHHQKYLKYGWGQVDLRTNLLESAAIRFDRIAFDFHMGIKDSERQLREAGAAKSPTYLQDQVGIVFNKAMPADLSFDPSSSDTFFWKPAIDAAVSLSEKATNKAYGVLRESIRTELSSYAASKDGALNQATADAEASTLAALEDIREQGIRSLRDSDRAAQAGIWWDMAYVDAFHSIELLLFAFVCIKSFFYVFARVAFHRDTGMLLTLDRDETGTPDLTPAQITQTGTEYLIPGDSDAVFYVSRRFQCRGKAPKFSIPQPTHAPIARLLHGGMTMNKVVMRPGDGPVSCTAARGAQFIEWNVREDEVVVFDFRNFVGMSESVRISTLISARLTTLLLGKLIFSTAMGPGKLVLMTEGRAEITDRDGAAGSLPPERLVAMRRSARLQTESELGIVDVYLSTAYVRPTAGAEIIVDVDTLHGSASGLGRFLRHFIWPG